MKPIYNIADGIRANAILQAPGSEPLPVYLEEHNDRNLMISCWELTQEEKDHIAKTGRVLLYVRGIGHPPVRLAVMESDLFIEEDMNKNCKTCGWGRQIPDIKAIMKCSCPLSGYYKTDVIETESCDRWKKSK